MRAAGQGLKVLFVQFVKGDPLCGEHFFAEKYSDKVRFVFRHFPLGFHQNAQLAAEAAAAANAQGKFWPYHDLLFQNQRALDRESLVSRELFDAAPEAFHAQVDYVIARP